MKTVAIVGTGLIGASFGLALKSAGFRGRILGVSSARALEEALSRGAVDEAAPLEEAVASADLIYLSQTIDRILSTLPLIAPCVRPGALVTDAGSTKTEIVNQALRSLAPGQFLGGHPMAGKEQRGAAHACAELFRDRTWILTPTEPGQLDSPAALEFVDWIGKIGAVPVVLSPQEHDRVVALTSHLPQLLSTALAATLADAARRSRALPRRRTRACRHDPPRRQFLRNLARDSGDELERYRFGPGRLHCEARGPSRRPHLRGNPANLRIRRQPEFPPAEVTRALMVATALSGA